MRQDRGTRYPWRRLKHRSRKTVDLQGLVQSAFFFSFFFNFVFLLLFVFFLFFQRLQNDRWKELFRDPFILRSDKQVGKTNCPHPSPARTHSRPSPPKMFHCKRRNKFMKAANRTGTENREPVHIEKSVNRVNRTA